MALGAFTSKKAAINSALAEMAKTLKRRELLAQSGKVAWTGDLGALRMERGSHPPQVTEPNRLLTPPPGLIS